MEQRLSVKEQLARVREDAIVSAVNRLLARKGFEAMTVDDVAAEAGMAKGSLYKRFESKEALAAAAMTRVLEQALSRMEQQAARQGVAAVDQLRDVARWSMQALLAGEMPILPAQNSTLRSSLLADKTYLNRLNDVSEKLGEWIIEAQGRGDLDQRTPPEVVLWALLATACDPVVAVMKTTGQYNDEDIVEMRISTLFGGLSGAASR
ncbi:TetR/AcrR family transcriptional regulator [Piscinibacter terrae]|uniref:TetR/AcrR family transcriptional regulator n=1 Tax=Piscinibacter terrae TaxID=2496871 RepID=A0A3N7HL67_9BURK|nr:TetR/AcrR family transcriptional regulator [Albitalea terrae]RQP21756.1 TetR/AcrR family transcriptional regulator [Albitalea terrae]